MLRDTTFGSELSSLAPRKSSPPLYEEGVYYPLRRYTGSSVVKYFLYPSSLFFNVLDRATGDNCMVRTQGFERNTTAIRLPSGKDIDLEQLQHELRKSRNDGSLKTILWLGNFLEDHTFHASEDCSKHVRYYFQGQLMINGKKKSTLMVSAKKTGPAYAYVEHRKGIIIPSSLNDLIDTSVMYGEVSSIMELRVTQFQGLQPDAKEKAIQWNPEFSSLYLQD